MYQFQTEICSRLPTFQRQAQKNVCSYVYKSHFALVFFIVLQTMRSLLCTTLSLIVVSALSVPLEPRQTVANCDLEGKTNSKFRTKTELNYDNFFSMHYWYFVVPWSCCNMRWRRSIHFLSYVNFNVTKSPTLDPTASASCLITTVSVLTLVALQLSWKPCNFHLVHGLHGLWSNWSSNIPDGTYPCGSNSSMRFIPPYNFREQIEIKLSYR